MKFKLIDLFANTIDELENEINDLFFFVGLQVVGWDKEGVVVAWISWLPPQDFKFIGTQLHKSWKHMWEKGLQVGTLYKSDWDAHTVDTALNQTTFLAWLGNNDWLHEEVWIVLELDLGMHLFLDHLWWEVSQIECSIQVVPNIIQVVRRSAHHISSSFRKYNSLIINIHIYFIPFV